LWLLAIENLAALTAAFDKDPVRAPLLDDLDRIHADGPAVGVHVVATADRVGAVPHTWAGRTAQKVLLGLADPADYAHFDVPRAAVPAPHFGRAVVAANRREIQIGHPGDDLVAAVATLAERWSGPAPVRTATAVLASPPRVRLSTLRARAHIEGPLVTIPVGLRSSTLEEYSLILHEHEHALIAGPARSGRSGALHAFAAALLHTEPVRARSAQVIAFAPRRSPLRKLAAPATMVSDYAQLAGVLSEAAAGPLVLLVDDAETVDDPTDTISGLLSSGREDVHVVAAVRNSAARKLYAHWTQAVRASRRGVLLMPDWSDDGDLLGVGLPRIDLFGRGPGRGYLAMDDTLTAVQLAQADDGEAVVASDEPAGTGESAATDPSRMLGAFRPAGERDLEGAHDD
jgi:S-DNA-T family DNA segregation ATPase FtsK/SpoIIIE